MVQWRAFTIRRINHGIASVSLQEPRLGGVFAILNLVYIFAVATLGLIIGSFLNVLILRLNTGRSVIKGRSQCFSCGHKLRWYELVPVVSFVLQHGRCRSCKSRISWQYLIIEISTSILFVLLAWRVFPLLYYPITALLIAILVYDLKHKIIPDVLVYIFIILAAISGQEWLTGFALFSFFVFLWFVSRGKWMGFGDAKLVLGIGFLLGPSLSASAMLIAFWSGALVGITLLFVSRGGVTMKSEIPFAPFLILGTLTSLLFQINIQLF